MPESLPAPLDMLRNQMTEPSTSPVDCDQAAGVINWYYEQAWQTDRIDRDQLPWLLDWMRHCHDARRFEIGDGFAVTLINEGRLQEASDLAEGLLSESWDAGLTHTLALVLAARGEVAGAIARLRKLVDHPNFATLPPEIATQVHLDLATLLRRQGSLFKAIPVLTQAVETAANCDDPTWLEQAADILIEQLVEQGGAEEAVEILSPLLDEKRLGLWQRVLDRLGKNLDPDLRERGMALMVRAGEYRTVLNRLVDQAGSNPQRLLLAFTAALSLQAPAEVTCPLAARLLASDSARQEESAPLIAAASVAIAESQQEKSQAQAKWHRDGVVQLISVAKHHGILEGDVREWAEKEGLYHEHGVICRAARHCLNKVDKPPEWLVQRIKKEG
ncbi:tetratricopeptide repeat protein [Guyparkeria sp.]|uniref:tetratricopeptide repeat protein n=1 Tax=Guyparkeria sp. TaxID=2035736 RepID=UPI003970DEA5